MRFTGPRPDLLGLIVVVLLSIMYRSCVSFCVFIFPTSLLSRSLYRPEHFCSRAIVLYSDSRRGVDSIRSSNRSPIVVWFFLCIAFFLGRSVFSSRSRASLYRTRSICISLKRCRSVVLGVGGKGLYFRCHFPPNFGFCSLTNFANFFQYFRYRYYIRNKYRLN